MFRFRDAKHEKFANDARGRMELAGDRIGESSLHSMLDRLLRLLHGLRKIEGDVY